eukprot:11251048-Alexandrium_andersonii.AAC.1
MIPSDTVCSQSGWTFSGRTSIAGSNNGFLCQDHAHWRLAEVQGMRVREPLARLKPVSLLQTKRREVNGEASTVGPPGLECQCRPDAGEAVLVGQHDIDFASPATPGVVLVGPQIVGRGKGTEPLDVVHAGLLGVAVETGMFH